MIKQRREGERGGGERGRGERGGGERERERFCCKIVADVVFMKSAPAVVKREDDTLLDSDEMSSGLKMFQFPVCC